jgi:hypothetical protein
VYANSGTNNAPADILTPDGKPVGEVTGGATDDVRTVSPDKLDDIADRLKGTGAKLNPDKKYPGEWYDLPDGKGGFGIRDSRNNGKSIDINIPGVPDVTKIHQR